MIECDNPKGCLYVIATPIGNLSDISRRALEALQSSDIVAAEDTRRTRKLLTYFKIKTRLVSCREHNEYRIGDWLIEKIREGSVVSLVSDGGAPGISDPGMVLVDRGLSAGVRVIPIPGASAVITALMVSGLPCSRFAFEGFLPVKSRERSKRLQELAHESRTIVFYEAPHRIHHFLSDLAHIFGSRRVSVCRELTKIHETVSRSLACDLPELAQSIPEQGEFTVIVGPLESMNESVPEISDDTIQLFLAKGMKTKEIAVQLSEQCGIGLRDAYQRILKTKKSG
jgi:16S rRNA (cytidine1402-2'-O)-methyltransferase